MNKPVAFRQPYVAARNMPHLFGDHPIQTYGGVLSRGQIIWMDDACSAGPNPAPAFVDGMGLISIDPRWLLTQQSKAASSSKRAVA